MSKENPALQGRISVEYRKEVDPYRFVVVFDRKVLSFPSAVCALSEEGRKAVQEVAEPLLRQVCALKTDAVLKSETDARLDISITLEGHTDDQPFFPKAIGCGVDDTRCKGEGDPNCTAVGFENNVRLSAARAQNVFFEMKRRLAENPELSSCLRNTFVVAGRGSVEPADASSCGATTPLESASCNRRVILKVRVQPVLEQHAGEGPP
jgi:hypothetical protein